MTCVRAGVTCGWGRVTCGWVKGACVYIHMYVSLHMLWDVFVTVIVWELESMVSLLYLASPSTRSGYYLHVSTIFVQDLAFMILKSYVRIPECTYMLRMFAVYARSTM